MIASMSAPSADPSEPGATPSSPRLHHVGYRVDSIARFLRATHWSSESEPVEDPLQEARLCLLRLGDPVSPFLELVEFSSDPKRPETSDPARLGLHHLCFSVPTKGAGEEWARSSRLLPVTDWKPAVLFGYRPVRFYYSRNRELLELLAEAV